MKEIRRVNGEVIAPSGGKNIVNLVFFRLEAIKPEEVPEVLRHNEDIVERMANGEMAFCEDGIYLAMHHES